MRSIAGLPYFATQWSMKKQANAVEFVFVVGIVLVSFG